MKEGQRIRVKAVILYMHLVEVNRGLYDLYLSLSVISTSYIIASRRPTHTYKYIMYLLYKAYEVQLASSEHNGRKCRG